MPAEPFPTVFGDPTDQRETVGNGLRIVSLSLITGKATVVMRSLRVVQNYGPADLNQNLARKPQLQSVTE